MARYVIGRSRRGWLIINKRGWVLRRWFRSLAEAERMRKKLETGRQ